MFIFVTVNQYELPCSCKNEEEGKKRERDKCSITTSKDAEKKGRENLFFFFFEKKKWIERRKPFPSPTFYYMSIT